MAPLPVPETPPDEQVLADVRDHGWHVVKVPECGSNPGWAFSIGLFHSHRHPELVLFGLPLDVMHKIINQLGARIRDGARYAASTDSDDVLEGYICSFRAVHPRWFGPFLGYAIWFYQGAEFPALQCLWPDREGNLPDSPLFDGDLVPLQPLLEFPDPAQARTRELLHALDV